MILGKVIAWIYMNLSLNAWKSDIWILSCFFFHMIMLNVRKLSRIFERATFYKRRPIDKDHTLSGSKYWPFNRGSGIQTRSLTSDVRWSTNGIKRFSRQYSAGVEAGVLTASSAAPQCEAEKGQYPAWLPRHCPAPITCSSKPVSLFPSSSPRRLH